LGENLVLRVDYPVRVRVEIGQNQKTVDRVFSVRKEIIVTELRRLLESGQSHECRSHGFMMAKPSGSSLEGKVWLCSGRG
jgi:hypothetical protein